MLSSHKMTLAILPSDRTERYLLPILLIMFVFGVALACIEVVNWWKARLAQFRPPPLAKLITYVREADPGALLSSPVRFPNGYSLPCRTSRRISRRRRRDSGMVQDFG